MVNETFTEDEQRRFWSRVLFGDGCWDWDGPPGSHGYGQTFIRKEVTTAPRLAYRMAHGILALPSSVYVCHRCDNRLCVRPSHLYAGSAADNMRDVALRGRRTNRKLTNEQAADLRRLSASGATLKSLAEKFSISTRAAWNVTQRRTYYFAD